jgi:hypothetical protein
MMISATTSHFSMNFLRYQAQLFRVLHEGRSHRFALALAEPTGYLPENLPLLPAQNNFYYVFSRQLPSPSQITLSLNIIP